MNKRVIKLLVLTLIVGMFGFFGYSLVTKGKHTDVGDKAYNFRCQIWMGIQPSSLIIRGKW